MMPTPDEIRAEKERLYESSSLRDDINDAEAEVLLQWGEAQVERLSTTAPDNFEKQARFLRQLIKGINRFVGQREFQDEAGQHDYMSKVTKWLPALGYKEMSEADVMSVLNPEPNMMADLKGILNCLTPEYFEEPETQQPVQSGGENTMSNDGMTKEELVHAWHPSQVPESQLEESEDHSIVGSDDDPANETGDVSEQTEE